MRGVVMYSAGDVRVVNREDPKIIEPTDAIIKLSATCICGSDLWPYRGIESVDHQVMGDQLEDGGFAVRLSVPVAGTTESDRPGDAGPPRGGAPQRAGSVPGRREAGG